MAHYTNKITKLCGTPDVSLEKVENNYGDVYYTIRFKTGDNGKFAVYTVYEFSSRDLAYQNFESLTYKKAVSA